MNLNLSPPPYGRVVHLFRAVLCRLAGVWDVLGYKSQRPSVAGGERGAVLIVALMILGLLSLIGTLIYAVTNGSVIASARFLSQAELRDAVVSGAYVASKIINEDPDVLARGSYEVKTIISDATIGSVSYSVYAREKGAEVVLLSVGRLGDVRMRIVSYLVKKDGKYVFDRWEH